MAAPNLINANTIVGKTIALPVTTQPLELLSNSVESGMVIKVNTIYVANDSIGDDARVTVKFIRQSQGTSLITNSLVPIENTLVVISKEAPIYLEEGDSLEIFANRNNTLKAIVSYETIV